MLLLQFFLRPVDRLKTRRKLPVIVIKKNDDNRIKHDHKGGLLRQTQNQQKKYIVCEHMHTHTDQSLHHGNGTTYLETGRLEISPLFAQNSLYHARHLTKSLTVYFGSGII